MRYATAIASGAFSGTPASTPPLVQTPQGHTLLGRDGTRCVFHDTHAIGGCRVQRALGHDALPLACRQFPRVTVIDPRGPSITLSHYCPTVVSLLATDDGPTTIVTQPPAFPDFGEYVGLDATTALPPLLHPGCLLDWDAWWAIEEAAVLLFDTVPASPLARLALAIEDIRRWRPGTGPLRAHVQRAFDLASTAPVVDTPWTDAALRAVEADVRLAIPAEWHAVADVALATRRPPLPRRQVMRFITAHTFASWAAYSGSGLRTWYCAIRSAAGLLERTQDPSVVDLLLRHLADSSVLTARWSRAERHSAAMNGYL